MMELKYLDTFMILARNLNYTKAGNVLGLTQAAVSRQIQYLEKSLHTQLFLRSPQEVRLTPEGQSLYQQALPLFDFLESGLGKIQARPLKIGTLQGLAEHFLIDQLLKIESIEKHGFTIIIDYPERLFQHLLDGKIDVMISTKQLQNAIFSSRLIFKERLVLISQRPIEFKALSKYPWALYGDDDPMFQLSKQHPTKMFKVNSYNAILKLVEKNQAIAVVPTHRLKGNEKFSIYPLKGHESDPIYLTVPNLKKTSPLLKEVFQKLAET